jgi:hypothetical protein
MGLCLAVVMRIYANLSTTLQRPVDIFFCQFWLTLVCTHILRYCMIRTGTMSNGRGPWPCSSSFVFLVLAQCRSITLRIGWSSLFFISKSIGIYTDLHLHSKCQDGKPDSIMLRTVAARQSIPWARRRRLNKNKLQCIPIT